MGWKTVRIVVFCAIIVAVCYANAIPNDFIADDYLLVAVNPAIRTIAPIHSLTSSFWGEKDPLGIYRPLVILSYSIEYSIWHRWAPGFHLVNMLLHTINGVLVFLLAQSLLSSTPAAWAAAAIYLVHPVHTESVAAIVGRSELLAAMFFFLAWLMFRQKRIGLCAIAFFLSLLSKENAIVFPAVIAIDIWISEGRFKRVFEKWRSFVPLAMSAFVYLGLRLWVLGEVGVPKSAQYLNGNWTLLERELTSGRAFLKYFQLLLAPVNVTGNYDFNSIPPANAGSWDAWLGLLLVGFSIAFAFWIARKQPAISIGIFFFYIALLPVSNWILPISVVLEERFLYLPSFGLAIIAGWLWSKIQSVQSRRLIAAGSITVAALLCISHNYIWRNEFTYYANMVRVFPNNMRGRQGYGSALLHANRLDEARSQFDAGLRLGQTTPLLVGMAGTLIQIEHNCRPAYPLLGNALNINGKDYFARWLLAKCYAVDGRSNEAEQAYRTAVQDAQFPDAGLLYEWGLALERIHRSDEAFAAYKTAAVIDPDNKTIRSKLAAFETTDQSR